MSEITTPEGGHAVFDLGGDFSASGWFASVFADAPDGIAVVDSEGRIRASNRRLAEQFGYGPDELVDRSIEDLVPARSREAHRRFRKDFDPVEGWRPMGVGRDLTGLRKDGTEIRLEISLATLGSGNGHFVVAVVRNVSDWDRTRRLRAATIRATERERRRIAAELHDDTLQHCAALLIQLRLLANQVEEPIGATILEIRDQLEEISSKVRRLASGLRPPNLDHVDIGAALQAWIRIQQSRQEGPRFNVQADPIAGLLGDEERLTFFRILQEAISNAASHSNARSVDVTVLRVNGEVRGTVSDDGQGFDVELAHRDLSGLGLAGMLERAHMIEADIKIASSPGEGCTVSVAVPIRPPVEEDA